MRREPSVRREPESGAFPPFSHSWHLTQDDLGEMMQFHSIRKEGKPIIANPNARIGDKPIKRESFTYNGHVNWINQFFSKLNLTNVTLFGQDWGGLIGLRLLCDNQETFDAAMIGNTALPTGDHDLGEPFKEWRKFTQTNESFKIGPIIHST